MCKQKRKFLHFPLLLRKFLLDCSFTVFNAVRWLNANRGRFDEKSKKMWNDLRVKTICDGGNSWEMNFPANSSLVRLEWKSSQFSSTKVSQIVFTYTNSTRLDKSLRVLVNHVENCQFLLFSYLEICIRCFRYWCGWCRDAPPRYIYLWSVISWSCMSWNVDRSLNEFCVCIITLFIPKRPELCAEFSWHHAFICLNEHSDSWWK